MSSAVLSHLHDDSNLVVENVVSCCIQQVSVVPRQRIDNSVLLYVMIAYLVLINFTIL